MIGRQLKKERYQHIYADLMQNAHNTPLCPICEVGLVVNGESYALSCCRKGTAGSTRSMRCIVCMKKMSTRSTTLS